MVGVGVCVAVAVGEGLSVGVTVTVGEGFGVGVWLGCRVSVGKFGRAERAVEVCSEGKIPVSGAPSVCVEVGVGLAVKNGSNKPELPKTRARALRETDGLMV
jgi:hypothetical protein